MFLRFFRQQYVAKANTAKPAITPPTISGVLLSGLSSLFILGVPVVLFVIGVVASVVFIASVVFASCALVVVVTASGVSVVVIGVVGVVGFAGGIVSLSPRLILICSSTLLISSSLNVWL